MLNRHKNKGSVYAMQNTIALFFPLILGWMWPGPIIMRFIWTVKCFFSLTYCRGSSTCENCPRHTGPLQRGTPSRGRHRICFLHPSLAWWKLWKEKIQLTLEYHSFKGKQIHPAKFRGQPQENVQVCWTSTGVLWSVSLFMTR